MALPPQGTNRHLYDDDNPLQGKDFDDKIKLLQDIDAYIRAKDPRVHQVSVSLAANWQAVQIMRAGGWRAADIRPLVRLNVSVVTRDGDRIEAGGMGGGGRAGIRPLVRSRRMAEAGRRSVAQIARQSRSHRSARRRNDRRGRPRLARRSAA